MKKSNIGKPVRPAVAVFLREARKSLKKHKIIGVRVICSTNAEGQIVFGFDGDKGRFQEARFAIESEMNPSSKLPFRSK
ncbi:MAG: hypothetical protein ACLQAH_11855 [Limisphaerales bacterium]